MISRLREILTKPDPALGYFNGDLRLLFRLGAGSRAADHVAAQQSCDRRAANLNLFLRTAGKRVSH